MSAHRLALGGELLGATSVHCRGCDTGRRSAQAATLRAHRGSVTVVRGDDGPVRPHTSSSTDPELPAIDRGWATVDRRTPRMRSACSLAWSRRCDPLRDTSPEAGVGHAPRLSRRRLTQGRGTPAGHQRVHLPPAGLAADQTRRCNERRSSCLATASRFGGGGSGALGPWREGSVSGSLVYPAVMGLSVYALLMPSTPTCPVPR